MLKTTQTGQAEAGRDQRRPRRHQGPGALSQGDPDNPRDHDIIYYVIRIHISIYIYINYIYHKALSEGLEHDLIIYDNIYLYIYIAYIYIYREIEVQVIVGHPIEHHSIHSH